MHIILESQECWKTFCESLLVSHDGPRSTLPACPGLWILAQAKTTIAAGAGQGGSW